MRLIDADALVKKYPWVVSRSMKFNLDLAPTIDAVPVVHARWRYKVAYVSHAHVTNIIWCSACNNGFHRIEGENFKFCPNCGAKMDGEVDDHGQ